MQAKHLWYNVDIRWSDLKDKLEVLAPTGLTREDIWRHLFLTKQRKNPYEEGCYTGEDVEDVKQKWEAKKHYFEQYKKDGPRPPCIDLDRAILGFNIDNTAAYQAIEDSKALHARRWQTKEGMYRIKRRALPDVRDAPLQDEQDNGYLMLPPGVLHMSALGRFGRFTLFSPRVSHSKHLPCSFCFVLCFGFGVFVALLCFCFLFCKCFGIPNSPRSLDLDDRQGLILARLCSKKKTFCTHSIPGFACEHILPLQAPGHP